MLQRDLQVNSNFSKMSTKGTSKLLTGTDTVVPYYDGSQFGEVLFGKDA